MKLALMVLKPGMGGHLRSAATIAEALRSRDVAVNLFVTDRQGLPAHIRDSEHTTILDGKYRSAMHHPGLVGKLAAQLKADGTDLIHSFDLHSHCVSYWLARRLRIPTMATLCGGELKHRYPFTRPVVVFSDELQRTLVDQYGFDPKDVIVEPGRVAPVADSRVDHAVVRSQLDIPEGKKVVLHICRLISGNKTDSVLQALQAVDELAGKRKDFFYVHVGAYQDMESKATVRAAIDRLNDKHGCRLALTTDEYSRNASDLIPMADVVIGLGRVCFESMSLGKPVAVVGDMGYAGAVSPDQPQTLLDAIADQNFSGRSLAVAGPTETLTERLQQYFDDEQARQQAASFGQAWFAKRYHVQNAVATYMSLYDAMLTSKVQSMDSPLRVLWTYRVFGGGAIMDSVHRYRAAA